MDRCIIATCHLVGDGDMSQLDNEWQTTSSQVRGGKVGKLTKQFWWNLGVQPETKILSDGRLFQLKDLITTDTNVGLYTWHIQYIYICIHIPLIYLILCSLADHVAIIWWFHSIYTLMHIVRKASFKMLLPNLKRKAEDLFFKREDVSGHFIVFETPGDGIFFFFSKRRSVNGEWFQGVPGRWISNSCLDELWTMLNYFKVASWVWIAVLSYESCRFQTSLVVLIRWWSQKVRKAERCRYEKILKNHMKS